MINKNLSVKDMSSKELQSEFDKRWFKFKDMPTHTNYSLYAEVKSELQRRGIEVCLSGYSKENSQIEFGM